MDGTKLRQTVTPAGGTAEKTDYSNGFLYRNAALTEFAQPEGRITSSTMEGLILSYEYYLKDHLGNIRVVAGDVDGDGIPEVLQEDAYDPWGLRLQGYGFVSGEENRFRYNGKELITALGLGWYDYGARMYAPDLGRWNGVDALAEKRDNFTPFSFSRNNPINNIDKDGNLDYPIITITDEVIGTADQKVIGYSGTSSHPDGVPTQVNVYKAVVTDTEDANFRMEFGVTRDAWAVAKGDANATNVAFEPKDANDNRYQAVPMSGGYPKGNGTQALKLYQKGSEVMHASPNETSVELGYRTKKDVASGVMIHVGAHYNRVGKHRLAASEGCFGIVNPGNSEKNLSNNHSNDILNRIIEKSKNSKEAKGKIEVVIEKRNSPPTQKKVF